MKQSNQVFLPGLSRGSRPSQGTTGHAKARAQVRAGLACPRSSQRPEWLEQSEWRGRGRGEERGGDCGCSLGQGVKRRAWERSNMTWLTFWIYKPHLGNKLHFSKQKKSFFFIDNFLFHSLWTISCTANSVPKEKSHPIGLNLIQDSAANLFWHTGKLWPVARIFPIFTAKLIFRALS